MKTYVTSDLHLGHRGVMNFCPETRSRFNNDVEYMNETMISEWNDIVKPEDTVYILGDVAMMSASKAAVLVNRLNGKKVLIIGNHDRKALKDVNFRKCFSEIHEYLEITYNGTKVCLFHYPIAEYVQQHRGAVHFHGHLHNNLSGLEHYRVLNVGFDSTGVIVLDIEDAISRAMKGRIKGHHENCDESC